MDLSSLINIDTTEEHLKEVDDFLAKEQAEKEQAEKAEKEKKYRSSGVRPKFWNESINTFIPKTKEDEFNLTAVKKFIEGKSRPMLFLTGNYGTGKTHLGTSITREKGGLFISSFELCTRFEMAADYNAEENRMELLEKYTTCKMLVIDEIGRGKPGIERLILPYIINERYERELELVMISNLKKEELIELLGGATLDRLSEVCSTLSFTGESKRKCI